MTAVLEERYLLVLMRRSGMTAHQIAQLSGVDEGTISKIRTGKTVNPRPDSWAAIITAAGGTQQEWEAFCDCRLVGGGDASMIQQHFDMLLNRQTEHYEKQIANLMKEMHLLRHERSVYSCVTVILFFIMMALIIADIAVVHTLF